MNKSTFYSFFIFCISFSLSAQNAGLTEQAQQLFKNTNSKLSQSEKNTVTTLSNLVLDTDNKQWSDKDGNIVSVKTFIFDLTDDGIEEVGISYSLENSKNRNEVTSMLFVKDKAADYSLNINASGNFYFLNLNKLVYPDVYVRNTARGLPIYRWNGNTYVNHKSLNPQRLKNYTVTDMRQASVLHSGVNTVEE